MVAVAAVAAVAVVAVAAVVVVVVAVVVVTVVAAAVDIFGCIAALAGDRRSVHEGERRNRDGSAIAILAAHGASSWLQACAKLAPHPRQY